MRARGLVYATALLTLNAGSVLAAGSFPDSSGSIRPDTWTDHDGRPILEPGFHEPNYWGHQFREGFVEPLSHSFDIPDQLLDISEAFGANPDRQAVNVNVYDEVPNSSWFTNRNHVRAVSLAEIRKGPGEPIEPARPWTVTKAKKAGRTRGFQIKDADGKKWLVKLDPRGFPQIGSGADLIARTLLHAAGYNVPHNVPVAFSRKELTVDPKLMEAKEDKFGEAELDSLLAGGATLTDGRYSAFASLFIPGSVVGPPSMRHRRKDDPNDRFSHQHRRELRGLRVLCAWLNSWDMKDQNFLDVFVETADTLGHVDHYVLDVGAALGAAAAGGKKPWNGFEHTVDFKWSMRRLVSLGFVQEPWRKADQETGIPSVGNFESEVYMPHNFRTLVPNAAFREMTDRDGYWGAKLVASFSNAQIQAAVEAVGYEDPRATDYLIRTLIHRRDKTARYYFDRVAPLDFFEIRGGALHFHDLAVDVGLSEPRTYEARISPSQGEGRRLNLGGPVLLLDNLGPGAERLELELSITGSRAASTRVQLTRKGTEWTITRVRHG
ncbi:MAG TPA: hypothetical protein VF720_12400 [Candidatus Eisenbacteria bacterium]